MFPQIKAARDFDLDSQDVEGLLAIGCPPDEYGGEASFVENRVAILTRFGHAPLEEAPVGAMVAEVWNEPFGPFRDQDLPRRRSAFNSVARRIIGRS
jgi:hypothetical protein